MDGSDLKSQEGLTSEEDGLTGLEEKDGLVV